MTIKYLPILMFLALVSFASCNQEDGTPIRNVRFDPSLLNKAQDGSSCTTYSYYYGNNKLSLGAVFTKQVLVSFKSGTTYDAQQNALGKYSFVKEIGNQVSTGSGILYTVSLIDGLSCSQTEQAIKLLAEDGIIEYSAPYFLNRAKLLGISNQAIVTIKEGNSLALKMLVDAFGGNIVGSLGENMYVINVDKSSKGNALMLANFLKEQQGIVHAEPDFIVTERQVPIASALKRKEGKLRL